MEVVNVWRRVMEGELKTFPRGYFDNEKGRERAIELSRYIIEEKYGLNEETVKDEIRYQMFSDNGLNRMLKIVFDYKLYNVVNSIYPEKYLPWQLHCTSMGYWKDKENRKKALLWLIDKKGWETKEEVTSNISYAVLREEGLTGMINYYKDSFYDLVSDLLDVDIVPWELNKVKKGFWKKRENRMNAMVWLIKKYGWTEEEFPKEICYSIMTKNGLKGMLCTAYEGSIYKCVTDLFPNKYRVKDLEKLKNKKISDWTEEQKDKVDEAKELYYEYRNEISLHVKDKIMASATQGKNNCEIEYIDVEQIDIDILRKQGFNVELYDNKYIIKW